MIIRLELELSPTEYRALARSAAGQQEFLLGQRSPAAWSLEKEAAALLRAALWREAQHQLERDELARWLGDPQYRLARQIGLGDMAPTAPEWIAEALRKLDASEGG